MKKNNNMDSFNEDLKHMESICFRSDNGADDGWAWAEIYEFRRLGDDIDVSADGERINYCGVEKKFVVKGVWNDFIIKLANAHLDEWESNYDSEMMMLGGWNWDVTIKYDNKLPERVFSGYMESPENFDELWQLMRDYGWKNVQRCERIYNKEDV